MIGIILDKVEDRLVVFMPVLGNSAKVKAANQRQMSDSELDNVPEKLLTAINNEAERYRTQKSKDAKIAFSDRQTTEKYGKEEVGKALRGS